MKRKSKIITAAIALIGFSTAASVAGTVAWFTASNIVNVSGMQIQAEAENGIVIANETHVADSDWKVTVSASHDGAGTTYIPTSTATLATWFHGLSDQANHGQSNVDYDTFVTPTVSSGVGSATAPNHFPSTAKNIYLLNDFYVQASAKTAITGQDIFIEKIAISGVSGSAELDKSIRVGLMVSNTFKAIYAPLADATLSYTVGGTGGTAVTALDVSAANDSNKVCDNIEIPAYTTAGTNAIKFSVFVYFEGEDVAHKSANITSSLDSLQLEFKLRNANHA